MPMLWANFFWVWGTLRYISLSCLHLVFTLKLFQLSHVNAYSVTKAWFGRLQVYAFLSFLVWVHHFFTMGNGALINSFFSISTMLIGVPTGVKLFNWLLTLYKGRITFESPMLFSLAFIPNFLLGGVTGVMLAMASADYQYHNTYFLVATSTIHWLLV